MGSVPILRRPDQHHHPQLNTERLQLQNEIRNREEEEAEIHQLLGGKQDEEVQSLEAARKRHLLDKEALHAKLGAHGSDMESAKEAIDQLTAQIKAISDQEENAARAQRRVDAVV